MLRRTQAFLKVSPYFLFLQDLSKAGALKGTKAPGKLASKKYRSLSTTEKAALQKRAQATTYASSTAYKRLAKREMARKNVPIAQRQAELKKKWADMKKRSQKKSKPASAAKPKSAKSKVKKAGKKAKKASKKTRA